MQKRLLNISDLSEYTGIPRRTLYYMMERGRFPVKPVAGMKPRRWFVEDVNRWMKGEK